jgi:hypothetical protein
MPCLKSILFCDNDANPARPSLGRLGTRSVFTHLFMSLIHTCELNDVNPFDYLTQLQKHAGEVSSNPNGWLPWNYRQTSKKQQSLNKILFFSGLPKAQDPSQCPEEFTSVQYTIAQKLLNKRTLLLSHSD